MQDFKRITNMRSPIELMDSLRLLRSRYAYRDTIVDYNRAQFELYVASSASHWRIRSRRCRFNQRLVPK